MDPRKSAGCLSIRVCAEMACLRFLDRIEENLSLQDVPSDPGILLHRTR
jgi:hypothetical protein